MWSGAVAACVLGAGVEPWIAVVMSEIPQRPRLDEFTATSAVDETGSDERGVFLASASVTRQVVLPTPQPLAFLGGHSIIVYAAAPELA